ncbi:FAD-dependent oxidoreductase [Streptomyces sp. NPDC047706]|uniref:FAD-dependent oxidoreductase n=1 Tax=Streptomyces sp. NPDC047706 TaxID=3365486 RepID=UPI0037102430
MKTNTAPRQRALIVGLGISGTASALRLHKAGWDVVVLERSPERRRGGYFMNFFETGITAAERLGIDIPDRRSDSIAYYKIDRTGRKRHDFIGTIDLVPGRRMPVVRGDIETAVFDALPEDVEIRYSSVPLAIRQDADSAEVDIEDRAAGKVSTERFDLVVGADGLRSTVRRMVFGPDEGYIHRLGYMLAACNLPGPVPGFKSTDGIALYEMGRSAWVFAFADRPPTVLFSYQADDVDGEFTRPAIDSLRAAFGPQPPGETLGWLLDQFEKAPDHLFDSSEQVRMDSWHKGRVVLVGDSAWCLTLYSGSGGSSGLAGADLLGTMLERYPADTPRALQAWEDRLRPFIEYNQASGVDGRALFVPGNRTEYRITATIARLVSTTLGRKLFVEGVRHSKMGRMKAVDLALT